MEAQHPLVALIRAVVRFAAALGETANAESVERARALVSEHSKSESEWDGLVALAAEMGADTLAAFLLGARFPPDDVHFVLAALLYVAGSGEPVNGGLDLDGASHFPA